ncbi:MAG: SDR family NAD(P)-dependent oxidoreductase, partial [Kiloniellales bacterium]|nr:SDR family NAD(P)-dependent oxidoreductase [Kiloniellales bacterium]
LRPTSDRSRRRVAAEAEWIALHERYGLPVHIFRLAGIYGPGRNTLETLRKGEGRRIVRPGQVFSRIHVEDIAKVLEASIASPAPGRIYNVCDDCAEEPARVVEFACKLLGIEPPEAEDFAQADLSPMARTFWADNKRVSNRRIHEELKVELSYPDYKAGLRALLNA